jgi:hypothetical protein
MVLTSPARVDAPTVIPALGGLLAAATVIDSADPHIGYGVEWFSFACGPAGIAPGMCEVADGVQVDAEKLFTGGEVVQAPPFAVYAGVVCDLFGRTYDAEVRARLAGGEERVVGKAFYEALLVGDNTGLPGVQVGTTAVTKDTIVDVIAALEQYGGENYAGRPVLHMNKETATWAIAADVAMPSLDGTLVTGQGTPIANSPGYPDGVVFLTGEVRIWRTPVEVHTVDATGENQAYALAERIYAVGTDCLLAYSGEEIVPPVPPTLASIDPESAPAGTETEFTVTGTGFTQDSVVRVNGRVVDTTYVSATELTFTYTPPPNTDSFDVTVASGGVIVGPVTVIVTETAPTITAVDPDIGTGGQVVTVTGTGFLEGA